MEMMLEVMMLVLDMEVDKVAKLMQVAPPGDQISN